MNKLKELWQYPVFRWCVLVIPHSIILAFLIISIDMNWFEMGSMQKRNFATLLIIIVSVPLLINFLVSTIVIFGKQIKELWQYPVFRLCVYEIYPLGIIIVAFFDSRAPDLIFVAPTLLIFPVLWVWRKPIWKLLKQVLNFLNKKADEG
jgi:hypothetical protein